MKEEYIKTLGLPDFERVPGDGSLSGGRLILKMSKITPVQKAVATRLPTLQLAGYATNFPILA